MKLKSRSIIEFSIELDENHSISYDTLERFFHRVEYMITDDLSFIEVRDNSWDICDEVLKYFIDKKQISRFSNIIPSYRILCLDFLIEFLELEKFYYDIQKNYKTYEREHSINSVLD
jgi:uncharacterized protein YutD